MKQSFNPDYSSLLNQQRGDFSIVTHVPALPNPSNTYKSIICYLKTDGCFYRCVYLEDAWMWEKVTYGPLRQYVLGVTWITVEYVFDDCVNSLKAIIAEMKRYGDYFADMEEGEHGVSLLTAVRKTNEIIKYVNRVCGVELEYVDEGCVLDPTTGDTCEELGTKLNLLIGVLNPHAGAKLEHEKLEARIEALEQASGKLDTFRELTADERVAGPQDGVQYYTKDDSGEYVLAEVDAFEDGVTYYVSNMTPGELAARLTALENQVSGYAQNFADINVSLRNIRDTLIANLRTDVSNISANVDELTTTSANIITKYIGWDKRGSSDLTIMERLIAVENATGSTSEAFENINQTLADHTTQLNGIKSNITALIATQKSRDEAQDAERQQLVALNQKYQSAFQTISAIPISEDMSFSELHDAVVAIVNAAASVVA